MLRFARPKGRFSEAHGENAMKRHLRFGHGVCGVEPRVSLPDRVSVEQALIDRDAFRRIDRHKARIKKVLYEREISSRVIDAVDGDTVRSSDPEQFIAEGTAWSFLHFGRGFDRLAIVTYLRPMCSMTETEKLKSTKSFGMKLLSCPSKHLNSVTGYGKLAGTTAKPAPPASA